MGLALRLSTLLLLIAAPAFAAAPSDADIRKANDLIYKASLGRAGEVETLLKQGADANTKNKKGVPVMAIAATRKDLEGIKVVQALKAGGGNMEVEDNEGQTPIFYAARSGNIDIVGYFLQQGAQYYHMDKSQNIARTYAFREGRTDVVRFMDEFVENQQTEIKRQYDEYYRIMNERKEREQAQKSAAAEAQWDVIRREEERRAALRTPEGLEQLVHDLSLASCGFQYWSYCRDVKAGDIKREDQIDEIAAHKQRIGDASQSLKTVFSAKRGYINKIVRTSQRRIVEQLAKFQSPTSRHENGVCTRGDIAQRCEVIARSFEVQQDSTAPSPLQETEIESKEE